MEPKKTKNRQQQQKKTVPGIIYLKTIIHLSLACLQAWHKRLNFRKISNKF